jgi:malonyl CoA-acyl carrier protein transacylase
MEDRDRVMISPSAGITSLSTKATHAKVALPERVFFFTSQISGRPYRLAVLAESEKEALSLIESTEPIGNDGPIPAKRLRALARQGIHLGLAEGTPLPLAFVFPGQGSHYAGMSHELYQTFPVIRQWMDRAAKVAEFDLLQLLFYDREEDLQKTRWQQPALFTMEYAMVQYLASLGITPAALAGHSLGELTALCLAGVYSFEDGFRIVNMRATCMDNACELNADPGVMMAVDAPLDVVEKRLAATENIYITNINSPHQVVLGGGTEEVKALGEELKSQGYRRTLLRVSMAFHSPIMRCIHDELDEFIAGIEFHSPRIPVISNTTMKPFSSDPVEIKKTVMAHLETTVHWMQNVRTLWNDYGVRVFVEVGPRDILSNMIADTFSDATCVQTCLPSAESLMYRTALANLYASGHLPIHSQPLFVTLPGQGKAVRPVPSLPAAAALKVARPVSAADPVERILQREINAFVMESFGRFLRPAILGAIRREHDPGFTEKDLDRLFAQALGKVDIAAAWPADVAPAAIAPVSTVAPPVVPAARAADTAAVPPAAEAVPGVDVDASDVTESVIRIIMDATGYERDEIQPDMDLREDLSIRSSRLPVIMDSLESHFGIKIEIEEFMDVRTIGDIADKISEVVARGQKAAPLRARRAVEAEPAPDVKLEPEPKAEKEKIKRLVFREIPISREDVEPIELNSGDVVAIVSASASPHLASETEDLFRQDYGVNPVLLTLDAGISQGEGDGFDLRDAEWGAKAGRKLQEMGPPAGIVFVVDEACADITKEMKDISSLLRGFFMMVKAFVDSPAKKFVLVLHKAPGPEGRESILAEGALGVLLSLVHEFSSIQCRCVGLDDKTETATALRGALDRNNKVVELICRNGEVYTREWHVVPSSFEDAEQGRITPGDVVVLSGGAFGITYHLARSLVPLGCRLVFLGRTALDPDIDFRALLSEQVGSTEAVAAAVAAAKPGLTGDDLKREIAKVARALQIVRNVEELRSRGIDAAYYRCDVADAEQTQHTVDEIIHRYGRIDGIVHGAGIIRDNFVKNMTADDFSAVTDVKFLGAWNLYQACRQAGLKFVTCLSSAASIQGNPGQVNYAAGNRLMSALAAHLAAADKRVSFKSFMLPPIEGAGMAEDPEVRAMMKRIKASYVHVDELAEIFCREMLFGRAQDVRVLFMRSLPDLKTVRLDASEPAPTLGEMVEATVCFKNEDFPLIDSISRVDLSNGEIVGHRTFVREKDLWINDHKPFRFMKHPIVSAIVALETLMEAARMLYPYLLVQGVRDAQFLDIIDCPPGVERSSVIACNAAKTEGKNLLCEVTLATSEISPSGQILERMRTNFRATVLMGCGQDAGVRDFPGFPVKLEELDTRPMDHAEAMQKYGERGELHGRYRVIEEFDGTGPGAIRGRTVYRQGDDFAPPLKTRYQYSPYALEALMQSAIFYIGMRNEEDRRLFIPQRMGELIWFRKCVDGERLTIEGRLKRENEEGVLWDARALDEKGQTVMYLRDMVFRWFSG